MKLRAYLAASLTLLLVGLWCIAPVSNTRAACSSMTGVWGGSCGAAPTTVHLTAPNCFGDASWTVFNSHASANCNQAAPDGTSTASNIFSDNSGFSAFRTTFLTTISNGTNYSLTGYAAPKGAPNWLEVVAIGSLASGSDFVLLYANTATCTLGTTQVGGSGVFDGATVAAASPDSSGLSYCKIVLKFHFTSGAAADATLDMRFAPADNSCCTGTFGQEFYVWQWGA